MFLTKLTAGTQRLIKNKDGASAIEYVIVAAMVAVVAIGFVSPIGDALKTKFQEIQNGLEGKTTTTTPAAGS
jgi:pilus assembly protein Flp/PilA